jgi:primosomal protein N' (replication factor Y)
MPTVVEAHALAGVVAETLGIVPWLGTSAEPAATVTRAWAAPVCAAGQLVIGTREIALWHLGSPGLVVVVEEGRAAMKSPQTPTVGVRDVVRRRSAAERFATVLAGPVPTVEALASGVEIHQPTTRTWPLVEVIDRAEEPPGSGVLLEATVRAVAAVVRSGGTVFVFVTRRTEAAAFRCVACGALRTCAACGAAATGSVACRRCGADLGSCLACGRSRFQALGAGVGRVVTELRRRVRADVVVVGEDTGDGPAAPVLVGVEADLPAVGIVDLAVVVDADGLVLAPHYRAEEDALRTLARVAATVGRGRGRRCLVQTAQSGHRVFAALRRGRPLPLLEKLLEERRAAGYPPGGELMAVEIAGDPMAVDRDLRTAADGAGAVEVLGPAPAGARDRWLVSGGDLRPLKLALRPVVQAWRDRGTRVRIDVDPVRL